MEIERKYLLKELPSNLENYVCYRLEQAYITTQPVIRARKKERIDKNSNNECEYILTIKSGGLMMREEYEIALDLDGYTNVLNKAEGNIITKDRYIIPLDNGLKLELDIFKDKFDGLVMGEVEFPDEETANKYTPPEYISEEVTFNKQFSNSSMSKMTLDEISSFLTRCNMSK